MTHEASEGRMQDEHQREMRDCSGGRRIAIGDNRQHHHKTVVGGQAVIGRTIIYIALIPLSVIALALYVTMFFAIIREKLWEFLPLWIIMLVLIIGIRLHMAGI